MTTEKYHKPGIYFGMPAEEYHADKSFSASGAKNLLTSPLTYWIRSRHNPAYQDSDTPAKMFGTALHTYQLEGKVAFQAKYARKPDKADFSDAPLLVNTDDLKEHCRDWGLKISGKKSELIERIREVDTDVQIWDEILEEFKIGYELIGDQTPLDGEDWDKIVQRGAIVRSHPAINELLTGGYPEVSIFWQDDDFGGLPMKCRVDYLLREGFVDLKSFANMFDADPAFVFVQSAIRYRWDVQVVHYRDGVLLARGLPIVACGEVELPPPDWIEQFRANMAADDQVPIPIHVVGIQNGDVPNLVARRFRIKVDNLNQDYWSMAAADLQQAILTYERCRAHYGFSQPWIDHKPIRDILDRDYPIYFIGRTKRHGE